MTSGNARNRLGNYQLLYELASGGMATVYIAHRLGAAGFAHLVVIKRVHPHLLRDAVFRDMFRDEAMIASQIRHPCVVPVTDVVEAEGQLFLVMDYIESVSLSALIGDAKKRQELVPTDIALRVVIDVLSGLSAAHKATGPRGDPLEVIHRDISPQNALVGVDGLGRLIDFGVAKARNRLVETHNNELKGKFGYMAPELLRGEPLTQRSDIFGMGVVLYETLTTRRLFRGETDIDTIQSILNGDIPALSDALPSAPALLDAVVARALARDPGDRIESASAMVEAIEAAHPVASTRQVQQYILAACPERIETRRAALRRILEQGPDEALLLPSPLAPLLPSEPRREALSTPAALPQTLSQVPQDRPAEPGPPAPLRAWQGPALGGLATLGLLGLLGLANRPASPPLPRPSEPSPRAELSTTASPSASATSAPSPSPSPPPPPSSQSSATSLKKSTPAASSRGSRPGAPLRL